MGTTGGLYIDERHNLISICGQSFWHHLGDGLEDKGGAGCLLGRDGSGMRGKVGGLGCTLEVTLQVMDWRRG